MMGGGWVMRRKFNEEGLGGKDVGGERESRGGYV